MIGHKAIDQSLTTDDARISCYTSGRRWVESICGSIIWLDIKRAREDCREIETVCARLLCRLGSAPHRGVLRAARPAHRDLGLDQPERSGRDRGGHGAQ